MALSGVNSNFYMHQGLPYSKATSMAVQNTAKEVFQLGCCIQYKQDPESIHKLNATDLLSDPRLGLGLLVLAKNPTFTLGGGSRNGGAILTLIALTFSAFISLAYTFSCLRKADETRRTLRVVEQIKTTDPKVKELQGKMHSILMSKWINQSAKAANMAQISLGLVALTAACVLFLLTQYKGLPISSIELPLAIAGGSSIGVGLLRQGIRSIINRSQKEKKIQKYEELLTSLEELAKSDALVTYRKICESEGHPNSFIIVRNEDNSLSIFKKEGDSYCWDSKKYEESAVRPVADNLLKQSFAQIKIPCESEHEISTASTSADELEMV